MAKLVAVHIDTLGAHRPKPGDPINGYQVVFSVAVNGVTKTAGQGQIWADQAAVAAWMGNPSDDAMWQELGDTLLRFIFWRWRAVNPAMDNPALIRGKTITFDLDTFGTLS